MENEGVLLGANPAIVTRATHVSERIAEVVPCEQAIGRSRIESRYVPEPVIVAVLCESLPRGADAIGVADGSGRRRIAEGRASA